MKLDDLAEFVVQAQAADIGHPELLRRNLLDSVACAIAALGGETLGRLRDQIDIVGGTPRATLIGGGRTSVDQAALYNSVAVRSADLLDTYLTPGGLCHPADNIGALLAVADSVRAGGADFLLAMAMAYEVQLIHGQAPIFGPKDTPRTKEQADYNLKYLLAVALLDGHVGPDQLRTERVVQADVQSVLRRITVHPDDQLTAAYPRATPVRIDLWLRDGQHLSRAQDDFHGAATRPFDWARTVEKFHWLAERHAERDLRDTIINTVAGVEHTPIPALTDLLTHVHLEEQR